MLEKNKTLSSRIVYMLFVLSGGYSGLSYAVTVTNTNLGENTWLSPTDSINVTLQYDNERSDADIRFFIDKQDVSTLFKKKTPVKYEYNSSVIPLPVGQSYLILYQIENNEWNEIAKYPLQVKTFLGFKQSEITSSVNVNIKAEVDNGYNGDAVAPPVDQQKQKEMTTNISFSSNASNDELQLQTNFNFIGVSKYEQALRFNEKGFDASKMDLSDYLVQLTDGNQNLSLGHINFGQNRFLISGFNSRGVMYSNKYLEQNVLDFSIAAMNGSNIVGYENITGLTEDSNHRVTAASFGYEFVKSRPGALRVEMTYMDASVLPVVNFDTGEIPDAEKSSGYGIHVSGTTESGTLTGQITYASSRYTNPTDPFLFQNDDVVAVKEQTDSARYAEINYEIFRSEADDQGNSYSITATLSHERVDPLYKSLAAFASADTQTNTAALSIQLGQIGMQISNVKNEDNIDNLATILKTKTDTTDLSVSLPFKQIFAEEGVENNWIPSLDIQINQVHQYGANFPTTFDPATHIPDQLNRSRSFRFGWNTEKFSFGYTRSVSEQDNRQAGRSNADFRNKTNSFEAGYRFSDVLNMNLGLAKVEAYDTENNLTTFDDNYSVGFNWGITDKINLTTNYTEAATKDTLNNASTDSYTGNVQLSWQFETPTLTGKKMPGQFFVSYLTQNNRNKDNVFLSETNAQSWTISTGINLSLF